ncbi:hypothetical protein O181_037567 [Austropuccinia psidii MF-1]|uniref:Ubiquitin-like domain-containing protein n=1 Tax=Austropuccinia psidii MF-1 TaxID=1389203 RepID=A0A9Q3DCZ5_9BASI|nr:hypothetical protein [Austropuccinia psidii MF-1]
MDSILRAPKLDEEINATKRLLQALSNQPLKLKNDYSSDIAQRPRRVNVPQLALVEPPAPLLNTTNETGLSEPIKITIKSLKPPLSFSLACSPTSTIAELKQLLCQADSSAPPPDAQRWVFKGKALVDNKLLKEYESIQTGETVHLMVKSNSSIPASVLTQRPSSIIVEPGTPHDEVPSTTTPIVDKPTPQKLNMAIPKITMDSEGQPLVEAPFISRSRSGSVHTNPSLSPHLGISESFKNVVTSDPFWVSLRQFLEQQFGPYGPGEANARQLWEHWFTCSKEWMSASEIARIREATGISGMAGR